MTPPALPLAALSDALAATAAAAASFVVAVHGRARGNASGLLWRPGIVVTAEEALARDDEITITLADGGAVAAELVGRDPSTDVAVLRVATGAEQTQPPAAAGSLMPGHLALAVGRAEAALSAAWGIVAEVGDAWRSREGGLIDARLRFDLRLPPRSEGGALIAADGALIGMAVYGPRRSVLAIPAATIARAADRILQSGSVRRGYLGIGLQPVRVAEGGRAAMVVSIDPKGPGARAGLLQGDIITAFEGETLAGARDLWRRLGPDAVGRTVALGLLRAGSAISASVTIEARPGD